MSKALYELAKCDNCGKPLAYMRIDVKMFPPQSWTHLVSGGPLIKIEKDILCEECFNRLRDVKKKK